MNVTDSFVQSIYDFSNRHFNERDIVEAKNCIADYVAVCHAGGRLFNSKTNKILQQNPSDEGTFPLIAHDRRASQHTALLINSLDAHAAELDDGVRYANLHPGISILTALLTLGAHLRLSAQDIIRATLVGYETSIRIASAIQPSHRNLGFHATGTCGAFGVAIGLCSAMSLGIDAFKTAITAAASGSSGMLNVMKDQSDLKAYNNSLAVFAGVNAFLLAKAGFTGSNDVLNGKWGYLGMKSQMVDYNRLRISGTDKPLIHDVYRKCYAACRHCHPAIEAVLFCKSQAEFFTKDIEKIDIYTYSLAVEGHDSTDVTSVGAAKMSTPYSVAVALNNGAAGLADFEEDMINSADIQQLLRKVHIIHEKEYTKQVPLSRPARARITLKNSKVIEHTVKLAKGEPEVPLTKKEIKDKFFSLLLYNRRDEREASKLWNSIYSLEQEAEIFFESIAQNKHYESQ